MLKGANKQTKQQKTKADVKKNAKMRQVMPGLHSARSLQSKSFVTIRTCPDAANHSQRNALFSDTLLSTRCSIDITSNTAAA
jgi:hypothetical protein